jgi:hypothetical protein
MLEEPISPELALVQGVPADGWPAADRAMIDPLDARRPAVAAGPTRSADATSVSVEALLFQAGLITADQLGELVRDSVLLGRPATEIAVERGLVSSAALQQLLGKASPAAPVALPFPLPAEALPPRNAVAEMAPPIEPAVVPELRPVVVPDAPPAPVSALAPFSPEALQALLAPAPSADPLPAEVQAVHEISPVETAASPPVAPVAPAMPPVAMEESPPVVLLSAEPSHAAEEPVVDPILPAMPPMAAQAPMESAPTPVATVFAVLLRLQTGERIAVDTAASFEAAAEVAREIAERFARATEWPLLAGRRIRPEAVVSVDIERTLGV